MKKPVTLKSREELQKAFDSKKLKSQSVYAIMFALIISIISMIMITIEYPSDSPAIVASLFLMILSIGSMAFIVTFLAKIETGQKKLSS